MKQDLIDMKIADDFWKNIKNNKIRLIRKSSDKFLKDLEKW